MKNQNSSVRSPKTHRQSFQQQSAWQYAFVGLWILQASGIVLTLVSLLLASQSSKLGNQNSETIGLILLVTTLPVMAAIPIVSLINLIGLPIYLIINRPRGRWLIFNTVSLIVSLVLVLYGAAAYYKMVVHPKQTEQSFAQELEKDQNKFESENSNPEITKEQAIELLQTCKLKGFYYTNQTDKDYSTYSWGELSSTGVVLTKIDEQPYRISIADRLIPELVPIARLAQKTCGVPQFWHDGSYEHFEDGKWYFRNEVVNITEVKVLR